MATCGRDRRTAERRVEEGERLYLRNVLQKYMETEDHETLFPVVATCLRLTPGEVDAIRERRALLLQQRRGLVRRLLGFGST